LFEQRKDVFLQFIVSPIWGPYNISAIPVCYVIKTNSDFIYTMCGPCFGLNAMIFIYL